MTFQPNDLILNRTYRIEKQLGQGAFGEVYQAVHIGLKTQRAIKVIRKGESGLNDADYQQYRERFIVEARIGASFHNQHIVPVHDFIDENDELFLVMDLEPGKSLADKIKESLDKKSPIPIEKAVKWIIEACEGLSELHSHEPPYVHRDIKPSNILIDNKEQACIADLGIIQLTTETRGEFTGGKNHPGTPAYMPPEQTPGHYLPLRPSADVYAMGCVLFQLLTGKQYYNNFGKRVKNIRFETPLWLDWIVAKAVNPDSKKRYADAKEMQKALKKRGRNYWTFLAMIVIIGLVLFGIGRLNSIPLRGLMAKGLSPIAITRITDTPIPNNNLIKPEITDSKITNTSTVISTKTRIPTPTTTITKTPTMIPTKTIEVNLTIGSTKISPIDGMEMVYVPAGEFTMGPHDIYTSDNELPEHKVIINGYWIDKTEVSNVQYQKCVDAGICTIPSSNSSSTRSSYYGNPTYNNYPVIYVNWEQASEYCQWAGRRLPTEAEWEKATGGGTFPWRVDKEYALLANFENTNGDTTQVGNYIDGASSYSVLDMSGNVWEWVNDWYDANYYTVSPKINPLGPENGMERVVRGGGWNSSEVSIRTQKRTAYSPQYSANNLGFRCVLDENTSDKSLIDSIDSQDYKATVKSDIYCRFGNSEEYLAVGLLSKGESVTALGKNGDWIQVDYLLDNLPACWIPYNSVTSVSSPQNLPIVTPPPLLPDLVINSLDYSLGPYVIPYTDSMDICVEVKNIGYSMSGESTAKIVVNDEVKFLSFPSIQPNKIVSGCVSFSKVKSFDGECSYNESLWLDYDNKVNEVNEKNNNGTDQWGNYVGYGEEWYCLQN